MMRAAISFCVPIASTDTIAPLRLRMSNSSGIALISLDFPSTARWASPRLGGVSRNQAQRAGPITRRFRAAQGLAVHGHDLALNAANRRRPSGEASRQRLRIQQPKHLAKRLRRRNAVPIRQKVAQPVERPLGDLLDPPPSRPPRTPPRQAWPAKHRPEDRSPCPEIRWSGTTRNDPENQVPSRSPPSAPFESILVNEPLAI